MGKYYHVTSKNNLESIMKNGLVPQYGFLSDMVLENMPAVYLFLELDEVSYAMKNWFGDNIRYVYNENDLILLEVDLPDNMDLKERFGWEAVCYDTISPKCISVIDFPKE